MSKLSIFGPAGYWFIQFIVLAYCVAGLLAFLEVGGATPKQGSIVLGLGVLLQLWLWLVWRNWRRRR